MHSNMPCLSKSHDKNELRYAITILDSLVKERYEDQVDYMFGAASSNQNTCFILFFLSQAVALYLLGEYKDARVSYTNIILHLEV
jgi:hypothetical protein